jgi:hypothetical protein
MDLGNWNSESNRRLEAVLEALIEEHASNANLRAIEAINDSSWSAGAINWLIALLAEEQIAVSPEMYDELVAINAMCGRDRDELIGVQIKGRDV